MLSRVMGKVPALLLAGAATALAQVPTRTPEQAGQERGRRDGQQAGRDAGVDLGSSQALGSAFIQGFRRGLDFEPDSRDVDAAYDDGYRESRPAGKALGLETGRAHGRDAASAAYAELRGRPELRSEAPPAAPLPDDRPASECLSAPAVRLDLARGRSFEMQPDALERGESPIRLEAPEPEHLSSDHLHSHAQTDGFADPAQQDRWADAYRHAFDDMFTRSYWGQRDGVPRSSLRAAEDDGRSQGEREARRRRTCSESARGRRRGFQDGYEAAFRDGYDEGWRTASSWHDTHAVVRVETAALLDGNDDGVLEPGEGASARVSLVNEGMLPAREAALRWSGLTSIPGSGSTARGMGAQSRRDVTLDLGRVDEGALMGAGAAVRLEPDGGEPSDVSRPVGRPIVIESVTAFVDARGGALVTVVRPVLRSVATRPVREALQVTLPGATSDPVAVEGLEPGEARDVELVSPASPDALSLAPSGDVALMRAGTRWMSRSWEAPTAMERAVETATRLPAGSDARASALTSIGERLGAEMGSAFANPKLYNQLDDRSELAAFARALGRLPGADRAAVQASVGDPLVERARARDTPRKVRRAVMDALGRD